MPIHEPFENDPKHRVPQRSQREMQAVAESIEDSLMMGRSLDEVADGPLEASWLVEEMT